MAVDLDSKLDANLAVVAQQGVADNQRLAMQTQLAFQKDLFRVAKVRSVLCSPDSTPLIAPL